MRKLNIVNVAFPFAAVRDSTAGGAEQVLLALDAAIVNSAHNSFVIASKGSKVSGSLIEGVDLDEPLDCSTRSRLHAKYRGILERVLKEKPIDLVHFHGLDFNEYLPDFDIPTLVTLHLPLSWYSADSFKERSVPLFFNCVSNHQYQTCGDLKNMISYIENGVSVPLFPPRKNRGKFALSLGRICPEKGYHLAITAAKKAKYPYILAGKVYSYPEHVSYFTEEILPLLDGFRYRFTGQIGPAEKRRLLGSARCLLVPSLVSETSSLVAMEALAHGTPVIAFKAGALTEIIDDGVNGFLVESSEEMAEAIAKVDSINPEDCYRIAQSNYSIDRMTNQYLELYKTIIGTSNRRHLLKNDDGVLFRNCA